MKNITLAITLFLLFKSSLLAKTEQGRIILDIRHCIPAPIYKPNSNTIETIEYTNALEMKLYAKGGESNTFECFFRRYAIYGELFDWAVFRDDWVDFQRGFAHIGIDHLDRRIKDQLGTDLKRFVDFGAERNFDKIKDFVAELIKSLENQGYKVEARKVFVTDRADSGVRQYLIDFKLP